jgi:hypothetical protein
LIQTNHFVLDDDRHHNGEDYQGDDCEICDRYAAPIARGTMRRPKALRHPAR